MNQELLVSIYNALSTIETKGQHTMTMASCLQALAQVINTMAGPMETVEEAPPMDEAPLDATEENA